jgi:hypothetical protein
MEKLRQSPVLHLGVKGVDDDDGDDGGGDDLNVFITQNCIVLALLGYTCGKDLLLLFCMIDGVRARFLKEVSGPKRKEVAGGC